MKYYIIGTKHEKGFTLIELLVSMSVLLVVSSVAVSLFISAVNEQKRILAKGELSGQLNYALEYMSKGLRMAKRDLTGDCLGQDYVGHNYLLTNFENGNYLGIKFINSSDDNACQEFFLDNKTDPLNPVIKETKNGSLPIAITPEKVKINFLYFLINGNKSSIVFTDLDGTQPRITVFLDANLVLQTEISAKVQTTISQRNLNIK